MRPQAEQFKKGLEGSAAGCGGTARPGKRGGRHGPEGACAGPGEKQRRRENGVGPTAGTAWANKAPLCCARVEIGASINQSAIKEEVNSHVPSNQTACFFSVPLWLPLPLPPASASLASGTGPPPLASRRLPAPLLLGAPPHHSLTCPTGGQSAGSLAPQANQEVHHRGIGQGGDVPELVLLAAGNLPQHPPHDLARPRLWEVGRPVDHVCGAAGGGGGGGSSSSGR